MYCEKARWALGLCRYGLSDSHVPPSASARDVRRDTLGRPVCPAHRVAHKEEGSLPIVHYRRTRPAGAGGAPRRRPSHCRSRQRAD
jgi:hypothetical protein